MQNLLCLSGNFCGQTLLERGKNLWVLPYTTKAIKNIKKLYDFVNCNNLMILPTLILNARDMPP